MKNKKILLLVLVCNLGMAISAKAQWTTSGSDVYYNAGNVGIGLENPESILHIHQHTGHQGLTISEDDNSVKIKLHLAKFEDGREYGFLNLGGYTTLRGNGERSHFDGKVGIGTTNPTEQLTVNGTARAEEIIVEENVGADFVFAEDYRLPELGEVEAYISQHRHLPEVPPASEMIREGVKVGELQMKLLQKIEELTLYVIELEKRTARQQKHIEALEEYIPNKQ